MNGRMARLIQEVRDIFNESMNHMSAYNRLTQKCRVERLVSK